MLGTETGFRPFVRLEYALEGSSAHVSRIPRGKKPLKLGPYIQQCLILLLMSIINEPGNGSFSHGNIPYGSALLACVFDASPYLFHAKCDFPARP